ncbi:MAG: hypothetical protein ACPH7H_07040 [Porticoccaceae bacterium]|jgi:hypothetical protein
MDSIDVINRIDSCLTFELDDLLRQFDAIMDSIMQTDVQRHTIRDAVSDWCDAVDAELNDIAERSRVCEELTLPAEEIFGTEV